MRYNGADPEAFAAYAYDGGRLLVDAIREVGPNRVLVRDSLAAVRRRDGVAGPMLFDPTLNNVTPVCLARVNHGSFEFE
jgi:ABC-type branched-subunit amino acid transport system substrate-binding protein